MGEKPHGWEKKQSDFYATEYQLYSCHVFLTSVYSLSNTTNDNKSNPPYNNINVKSDQTQIDEDEKTCWSTHPNEETAIVSQILSATLSSFDKSH
jgi:hypothetical protein